MKTKRRGKKQKVRYARIFSVTRNVDFGALCPAKIPINFDITVKR